MKPIFLGNQFFGRKPQMHLLKRRVIDLKEGYRQNVALLGNRFVGKTEILYQFMSELEEESMTIVYADLDHCDLNVFAFKFIGGLLHHFSRLQKLTIFDDIPALMENVRTLIPQTVGEIKKIQVNLSKEKFQEAFTSLMALPEVFTAESGKFCVIILDEFQNLDDLGINDVFQELGKKIMTQKRCIYIMASSFPISAKRILSEKLSLLFGNFEVIDVEPFDSKTSQEFIVTHLSHLKISQHLSDFLVNFTGGSPLYLKVIVQELMNLCAFHQQNEIFVPLLAQAIENVIFHPWGVLNQHFEITVNQLCFSNKTNRAMSSILLALAYGHHKLREVTQEVGLKPQVLNQRLSRLTELGMVEKNGHAFYFPDKLFKYWIKYVFQKRLRLLDPLSDRPPREFQDEFKELVASFQIISNKDLSSRIVELLYCFDNASIHLNGRRYKLPVFREVVLIPMKNPESENLDILKASSPEGIWLIGLKKENLCENDVNAFLSATKTLEPKPQRRILISLSDLDETTRIKALEERMWIWNEKEINALLGFYDKPFIVQ